MGNLTTTTQQYPSRSYSRLADQSCSCLSTVDITQDTIRPGDLITLGEGHIMMVEAVKQPLFKGIEQVEDCNEENIDFETLQVRLNHASGTNGGPGSTQFFDHQYPLYVQTLRSAVSKYKFRCGSALEEDSSIRKDAQSDCDEPWTENDQNQYTNYYYNSVQLGLPEDEARKWKDVGENLGSLAPSLTQPSDLFGNHNTYPMWPQIRKRLSSLCKVQFAKYNNQSPPSDAVQIMNATKDAFKVIRHASSENSQASPAKKDLCRTPEEDRPKLRNCLGEEGCPEDKVNQCRYDHGGAS